jgi:hypothetical protein
LDWWLNAKSDEEGALNPLKGLLTSVQAKAFDRLQLLVCAQSRPSQESADRSLRHLACGQVDLSFCDFIQCIEGHVPMLPALSLSGAHLKLVTGGKIVQYQETMDWPLQDNAHGKAAKRACSFSPEENGSDILICLSL